MNVSDFDYNLPAECIAQHPVKIRDHSKLMVLDRHKGKVYHKRFTDLPEYLNRDDLLVINNSKVFPAKLSVKKASSDIKQEGLIVKVERNNIVKMLIKNSKRLSPGTIIIFEDNRLRGEVIEKNGDGMCTVRLLSNDDMMKWLKKYGHIPLPHYMTGKGDRDEKLDRGRYQTIYAKHSGSIAAPTAGFHFTKRMINGLQSQDIKIAEITLHIGYATFKPVRTIRVKDHKMGDEEFIIPEETAENIAKTKEGRGRVIAVGTTVSRALEAYAHEVVDTMQGYEGHTKLFIYPSYRFRLIDGLLTNFHLPKSTLLMLVCAFGGKEFILSAYQEAVRNGYRFYSYGDAMLIL